MTTPTVVRDVAFRDLDIALTEPFGISTGAQPAARNVLVRVTLESGAVGYGEAAPFEAVNGETRAATVEALARVTGLLRGYDARAWRSLGAQLRAQIPHAMSACCALETAALDAMARHFSVPLWVLFGGAGTTLETDCTVTTGTTSAARDAAARIARGGFRTVKLKVGGVALADDVARVEAVVAAAPGCGLLLDANGAMATVEDALSLAEAARAAGGRVVLFEQPMARDDWAGMRAVAERLGAPVAADEAAACVADVLRAVRERAAHVINVKIMKSGIAETLDMVAVAKAHGLGLMVGGMVESTLAMTTSACLAAGAGGFAFVDLDTPLFMAEQLFDGGAAYDGPSIEVGVITEGHGVTPRRAW